MTSLHPSDRSGSLRPGAAHKVGGRKPGMRMGKPSLSSTWLLPYMGKAPPASGQFMTVGKGGTGNSSYRGQNAHHQGRAKRPVCKDKWFPSRCLQAHVLPSGAWPSPGEGQGPHPLCPHRGPPPSCLAKPQRDSETAAAPLVPSSQSKFKSISEPWNPTPFHPD